MAEQSAAPRPEIRFFEDYEIGQTFETGTIVVSSAAVERFAEYDPQVFHRSESAGATTFGGVIASGWQTAAYTMRLMVDAGVFPAAGGIGVGSDALRWLRPVRPGDALHAVVRVESLSAPPGKRSGAVRLRVWTRNQHGEDVMIQVATAQVVRRTVSPP